MVGEVLSRLKADPEVKHIPVVIASIAANEGRERLFGAVDLLTKPIERGGPVACDVAAACESA